MTDENTAETTEPEETTEDVQETDTPEVDTELENEPEPQSKREARYRTQLRDAEAQRDTLAAQVEALQRAEVERLAANEISQPGALWAAQVELANLLNDDGTVDPVKVRDAARSARENLGLAASRVGRAIVPKEGTSLRESSSGNAWQEAFK